MASNTIGTLFKVMTWGESHGPAIGVVIDGCPSGLSLEIEDIKQDLASRAPGKSRYTSPRKEEDLPEILSGVFEGKTTGAPISILIWNRDADSSKYESLRDIYRPGHANYTYLQKYGIFDHRGGGRSSARETACRVMAGSVAKKLLKTLGIDVKAFLKQVGSSEDPLEMEAILEDAKTRGDSIGGVVGFRAEGVPAGLGDPIYEKLEANLAHAMLSIPASKGFEIGFGFRSAAMYGSEHNDLFVSDGGVVKTETNQSGGTLGGISNGMPLIGQVAFKPTSSINQRQQTLNLQKERVDFQLPEGSRHDPCVAIRAVPVVEAMLSIVLVDAVLMNRSARL